MGLSLTEADKFACHQKQMKKIYVQKLGGQRALTWIIKLVMSPN